ncbi:MAG: ABC transporter permease [Verrucomicrobiota bacterium]
MNVRLKKEFQSLFWPWLVAALIGLVPVLSWMLPTSQFDQSFHGIYMLACVGFVLGTALLATLPFGEEFSLRTMPVLLSHPITRWQIWTEKFKITLILTVSITLLNGISCLPFWGLIGGQLKLALAFLIYTVCSGAFWVMFTRSTIGGTMLCLFSQAIAVVMVYVYTQTRYFDIGIWDTRQDTEGILLRISLVASPVFLWLGWKLFSRLQDTGTASLEIPFLTASDEQKASSTSWFRTRASSPRLNLLRKELSHFQPLLLMAYLFSALWIGMLLLNTFYPLKHSLLSDTLNGFLALYATMVLVTAGCISLGEEKELGIHACNLTLPIAWRRQWLLKISLASLIGLCCAVLLPLLLAQFETLVAIKPMKTWAWQILQDSSVLWALCLLLASFVTVSFWAATVTKRTIHAAFLAAFMILLVAVFHTTGKSMKLGSGDHTAYFLDWVTARWQLNLGWAAEYSGVMFLLSFVVIGSLFLPLSRLSYQEQSSPIKHVIKVAMVIITLSWTTGIAFADLQQSASYQHSETHPFRTQARAALLALKADVWPENYPINLNRWYPQEYLKRTGKLSPFAAKWLEGSAFRVEQNTHHLSNGRTTLSINAYLERPTHQKYLFGRALMYTNFSTNISSEIK